MVVLGMVVVAGCATGSRPMPRIDGAGGTLPSGLPDGQLESFPSEPAAGRSAAASVLPSSSFYDRAVDALTDNAVVRALGSIASTGVTPARGATSDVLSLSREPKQPGPDLHTSMARLSERAGNIEHAVKHYEKALSMDDTSLEALMGYAHLHDRQGNFEQAVGFYRRALEHHPEHAAAHNDLGLCLARSGQLEKAVAELQRAVSMQPGRKLYHNNLATVLAETDQRDEALAHWSRANGLAIAHYNLGRVLQRKGLIDEAARQYRMALQVDGTLSQAGEALAATDRAGAHTASRPAATSEPAVVGRPQRRGDAAEWPAPADTRPVRPSDSRVAPVQPTGAGTGSKTADRQQSSVHGQRGDPLPPTPEEALAPQSMSVHLPPVRNSSDQPGLPPTPDQLHSYPQSSAPYVYPGYPPRQSIAPYHR